jgi:phosphatidylinositol alpha-1,6-mannosyltransferase
MIGAASFAAGNGGIARVARLSAMALMRTHCSVEALSLLDERSPDDLGGLGVKLAFGSRLRFLANVHLAAFSRRRFVYDSAGLARAHPRFPAMRRPLAVWMHGIEVWEDARPNALHVLRSADLILCNSKYTLERAERLHGPMPAAKVCWLATEAECSPPPRKYDGPPVVLILARHDVGGYKGHIEMLDAWPSVVAEVPDARLVVVGGGAGLDAFRERVRGSPVAHRIDVRGYVPEDKLEDLWTTADVFAMPSRGEGFGIVYIEAMRHGLPVIASIHDAGAEINVDGITGYNVDLGRPRALVDCVVSLLTDDAVARALGAKGRERWEQSFRPEAFYGRFLSAARDFLAQ